MITTILCVVFIVILTATAIAFLHAEIYHARSFAFDFSQSKWPYYIILASSVFAAYASFPYFLAK